jgi:hypothetical protein
MAWIEKLPPRRNQRPHEYRWRWATGTSPATDISRPSAAGRRQRTLRRRWRQTSGGATTLTRSFAMSVCRPTGPGSWTRSRAVPPLGTCTPGCSPPTSSRRSARALAFISPEDIQGWLKRLQDAGAGQATVSASYRLLRAVPKRALASRLTSWDPTTAVEAPPPPKRGMRFLSAEEVARLAEAVPDRYRALVYLLAYGGLRIVRLAALRGEGTLTSGAGSASPSRSPRLEAELGPPKSEESIRTITLPRFLRQMIEDHRVRCYFIPMREGKNPQRSRTNHTFVVSAKVWSGASKNVKGLRRYVARVAIGVTHTSTVWSRPRSLSGRRSRPVVSIWAAVEAAALIRSSPGPASETRRAAMFTASPSAVKSVTSPCPTVPTKAIPV